VGGELETRVVHQIVADGLAPYVGASMARASVNGHIDKLGVSGSIITPSQIDTLLERLGPGLRVFIGPVRGGEVVEEIREKLLAAGRGR